MLEQSQHKLCGENKVVSEARRKSKCKQNKNAATEMLNINNGTSVM